MSPSNSEQFPEWMSASDALTWQVERDPVLRSTISSVWWLDQAPDRDRFWQALERMVAQVPRLRQRVIADRLGIASPRWVADENFRLESHVTCLELDGDGQAEDVLEIAGRNHSQSLDRDRALWNLHLVEGLEGGGAAVVLKIHHAIADGEGFVRLGAAMFEFSAQGHAGEAPPPDLAAEAEAPERRNRSHLLDAVVRRAQHDAELSWRAQTAAADGLVRFALDPIGTPQRVSRTMRSILRSLAPATAPLSPLMTERSLDFSLSFLTLPLADFKRAAKATSSTINDLFMSGVVGGMQRYHKRHEAELEQLRITMPISLRDAENDQAGNQFAPARLVVDASQTDPEQRLEVLRSQLRDEVAEPGLPYFQQVSELIQRLGPAAATATLSGMLKACDVAASNVQGVPVPIYLGGAKVERMVPFGPCAGAAVNITLLSYAGEIAIGINSDRAAVSAPDDLRECLAEAFEEVLA